MYCRGYDRNGFVGTQAVGQMMYGYVISCTQVHELPQSHCGDNREGTLFSWFYNIHTDYVCYVILCILYLKLIRKKSL